MISDTTAVLDCWTCARTPTEFCEPSPRIVTWRSVRVLGPAGSRPYPITPMARSAGAPTRIWTSVSSMTPLVASIAIPFLNAAGSMSVRVTRPPSGSWIPSSTSVPVPPTWTSATSRNPKIPPACTVLVSRTCSERTDAAGVPPAFSASTTGVSGVGGAVDVRIVVSPAPTIERSPPIVRNPPGAP